MNKATSAIKASIRFDSSGNPKVFTLSLGNETVALDPGKTWLKVDEFKWVTRGLIEAPQSFHVLPNGAIDVNGEHIVLDDRNAVATLEREINKSHAELAHPKPPGSSDAAKTSLTGAAAAASRPDKVIYHVRLDHLGHLVIECHQGEEKTGTGLRGLPTLVQNGLMLKPKSVHVDPLQKYIEIDGVRYECTEIGARQLEDLLNSQYAPSLKAKGEDTIDIRENPASSTGFDIHFVTAHSGLRIEVKGHLSQEKLDILQDQMKCDLLKPGILLRLSPPNLLIRRRRPDGGEERIPEFPDIHYRRVNAQELQQVFNHPSLRRKGGNAANSTLAPPPPSQPVEIVALRLVENPQNKMALWLECHLSNSGPIEGKAFTHHNVAELQHRQIFLPHLDVALSLDHRNLSILDKESRKEQHIQVDHESSEDILNLASQMLTAALKPPTPQAQVTAPAIMASAPVQEPPGAPLPDAPPPATPPLAPKATDPDITPTAPLASPAPSEPTPPTASPLPAEGDCTVPGTAPDLVAPGDDPVATVGEPPLVEIPAEPELDPAILALFSGPEATDINAEIFRALSQRVSASVQDVLLDMPRIFTGRRFEILSLTEQTVSNAFELRSEGFSGFYLSHVHGDQTLLVYACQGRHVEWGRERCLARAAVAAEPSEFNGPSLLGMAIDKKGQFVFVVSPACKKWITPHEKLYQEVYAHFITVEDLAANPGEYDLVWPVPPVTLT